MTDDAEQLECQLFDPYFLLLNWPFKSPEFWLGTSHYFTEFGT